MKIKIKEVIGQFAENKDIAKKLREEKIIPSIDKGEHVYIDFSGVDSSTQSFIHALLSEIFQINGESCLELFHFENCNKAVKSLIGTVINYSLE